MVRFALVEFFACIGGRRCVLNADIDYGPIENVIMIRASCGATGGCVWGAVLFMIICTAGIGLQLCF